MGVIVRRALALGLNYDFYQWASGSISGVIALYAMVPLGEMQLSVNSFYILILSSASQEETRCHSNRFANQRLLAYWLPLS
jgi:hypothetical protein